MKKLAFFYTVLLCALLLSGVITGCGQAQSTAPDYNTTDGKIYENKAYGFSCLYPVDWQLQESPTIMLVLFAGPMDTDGGFSININIFVEELVDYANISLDEYMEISEIQFQESLDDYQRLALNDTTISGMAAKLITYSFSLDTLEIKGTQAFLIRDNIAYIITYSATPESYDEYYPEFELVYMSFIFE